MKTAPRHPRFTRRNLVAILRETAIEIREAQLLLAASSLSYTTLLSIIPLLAVCFAIFQIFGGMEKLYAVIEPIVLSNLAKGTGDNAIHYLRTFIGNIKVKTLGAGGLAALIFTSISLLSSAETAINRVWKTKITRPLFHRIAGYWFFITLGPVAFSVLVAALTSQQMPLTGLVHQGFGGFLVGILVLSTIYKWTPNRHVHWAAAVVPALVTEIFLFLARNGYAIYTHRMVSYNKIYGSLGAVPIFMVWIYTVWIIILAGAAFGSSIQKRMDLK
jgi:membrane protein